MSGVLTLGAFIDGSAESELRDLRFDGEFLHLHLECPDLDGEVRLRIPTRHVRTEGRPTGVLATCFARLTDLRDHLTVDRGRFIPPAAYAVLAKDQASGRSTAYGQRVADGGWLFTLVGARRLVVALVKEPADIAIRVSRTSEYPRLVHALSRFDISLGLDDAAAIQSNVEELRRSERREDFLREFHAVLADDAAPWSRLVVNDAYEICGPDGDADARAIVLDLLRPIAAALMAGSPTR